LKGTAPQLAMNGNRQSLAAITVERAARLALHKNRSLKMDTTKMTTFPEQKQIELQSRKEWLQSAADTGAYLSQAAKAMGMTQGTLCLMAARYGVKFNNNGGAKNGQKMMDERFAIYKPMIAQGMTITQIAVATGETRKNVYAFIKRRLELKEARFKIVKAN